MHSKSTIRLIVFMFAVITALCMMLIHSNDMAEQEIQRGHYCERVKDYKESNGQYGWPPYKGEC